MTDTETPPLATIFGEFVKNEDEEYDVEELAEPWHRYRIKEDPKTTDDQYVLYPIRLGEVLNERYLVEHKLGFGGGSTVWMALDLRDNKNVALKVMMSPGEWCENEIRIQDEIIKNVQDTSHLVIYTAAFFLLRNNGSQQRVLVYPLTGPCIDPPTLEKIPMATRMSAARQLLESIASLHQAGIIHRDLNERNCMWGMTSLNGLITSAKYEALGRPLKQTIPFVDLWKQGELVCPVKVPRDLCTEEFYLGDFGLSKKITDPTTQHGHPPIQYCSPDRLHKQGPSFACDMWSYMIVFSMLYLTFTPFSSGHTGGIITGMVECLGPLPEQWKGLYPKGIDSWYDQSRASNPKHDLASRIARFRPDIDPVERQHVQSIMSKVFTYSPEKRPSATELLRDPSFRAIMGSDTRQLLSMFLEVSLVGEYGNNPPLAIQVNKWLPNATLLVLRSMQKFLHEGPCLPMIRRPPGHKVRVQTLGQVTNKQQHTLGILAQLLWELK
ncbi:unnamed protein product [Penicillium glandicola]